MPMTRLTTNVQRHTGAGFTAEAIAAGEYTVMTIRPGAASLTDFAALRLEAALSESVSALIDVASAPAAGEMVLPIAALSLDTADIQADGAAALAFDEVNANLRGLDGVGGTYARASSPTGLLQIGSAGLTLQAANALAFDFSPRNVYGPGYAAGDFLALFPPWTGQVNGPSMPACGPDDDLSSFYLVILDSRRLVVSLAAIRVLAGTACP